MRRTFGADGVNVLSVNKDSSDAPTVMGTGGWIGNSTTNRGITIVAANRRVYFYGATLRTSGATADSMNLLTGDGAHLEYESCYLWHGNTNTGSNLVFGGADVNAFASLKNCTLRFGSTSQAITIGGRIVIEGGSISADGSAISTIFRPGPSSDSNATDVAVSGFDMSAASATATIVGDAALIPLTIRMSQCKLPSGAFTWLGTQTNANRSSAELYVFDCAAGDTHGRFGYHNALGSVVSDTGIKYTGGAAAQGWKIVTTATASFYTPFVTPWINWYNTGTSSITPRLEILRDGSATAYDNDEVWGEFSAKTTAGYTLASLYSDRMAVLGSPAAQTSGTDTWDGENATHWAGKVDSGSAITPAEVGDIRARVCVGLASATVYVDPFIRT